MLRPYQPTGVQRYGSVTVVMEKAELVTVTAPVVLAWSV